MIFNVSGSWEKKTMFCTKIALDGAKCVNSHRISEYFGVCAALNQQNRQPILESIQSRICMLRF